MAGGGACSPGLGRSGRAPWVDERVGLIRRRSGVWNEMGVDGGGRGGISFSRSFRARAEVVSFRFVMGVYLCEGEGMYLLCPAVQYWDLARLDLMLDGR